MTDKKPISFKIFIAVISITTLVIMTATLLSYYSADRKYAMVLAFIQFLALAFTTVGIYSGFIYKTETDKFKFLNKVGLIGNALVFLFTIGLMAMAITNLPRSH